MYLDEQEHAVTDLGSWEGKPVLSTAIKITRAGDGLSQALKVDPQVMHPGDRILVVMETTVDEVTFKPVKDTDGVQRIHKLVAGTATTNIDPEVVRSALAEQADRIERAREAEAGVSRLPTDQELRGEHVLGGHADGLRDGCPLCDEEVDALREEEGA